MTGKEVAEAIIAHADVRQATLQALRGHLNGTVPGGHEATWFLAALDAVDPSDAEMASMTSWLDGQDF